MLRRRLGVGEGPFDLFPELGQRGGVGVELEGMPQEAESVDLLDLAGAGRAITVCHL
jgi:hypothetical protein